MPLLSCHMFQRHATCVAPNTTRGVHVRACWQECIGVFQQHPEATQTSLSGQGHRAWALRQPQLQLTDYACKLGLRSPASPVWPESPFQSSMWLPSPTTSPDPSDTLPWTLCACSAPRSECALAGSQSGAATEAPGRQCQPSSCPASCCLNSAGDHFCCLNSAGDPFYGPPDPHQSFF